MFKAEELIKQAIERYKDNIAVACSFGKDSIIVLHMALNYNPNIKVVFENTGVEFPETIKYKKMMVKKWNLNLIETKPIKTFWQCLKEYGLPQPRGKGKHREPKCCYYCKNRPFKLIKKEFHLQAIFTGLTKWESRQRKLLVGRYDHKEEERDGIKFCGQRYYMNTDNIWKYHPIAYWKEEDVWNYIKKNNIPINPVYTKWNGLYKRVGCLPCTAYIDWEKKLPKSHPKLYQRLKKLQHPSQRLLCKN